MSYILEALKKADAERERGAVPGLHTQAEPLPLDERPTPSGTRPGTLAVLGLLVGAALVMGYTLWGGGATTEPEPASTGPQGRVPAPLPPLARATLPEAPPPLPKDATTSSVSQQPQVVLAEPVRKPSAPLDRKPAVSANPAPRETTEQAPPARSAASESSNSAQPRPFTVGELPESVRRELPTLNIGGAMHSDTPSSRMLILSNGVFHEGEQPVPGLVLEEIRLKSAVFRYKGYRYSVNY